LEATTSLFIENKENKSINNLIGNMLRNKLVKLNFFTLKKLN